MHILIDIQGCQSASKYRGIGRSTLAMSKAIIRNAGNNRVSVLINGMYPLDNINELRHLYLNVLPPQEIFTFSAQGPVAPYYIDNKQRNQAARVSRDVAIANINPDIVFVISFFEGHVDNYIVSIPNYPVNWRTVCVCHDLIPLLNPDSYLADPNFKQFYMNKLHEYERADAIFAISESAAEEVKKYTAIDHQRVLNISSAVDPEFCVTPYDETAIFTLRQHYQLPDEFILTLAMIEPRKNIEALIKAFSQLSETLRDRYPLVLACKIRPEELERTKKLIEKCGIKPNQIVFTGYLPDSDLIALYNICKLFVFPSLHEGFGLPPLEAMSCGAPTISSDATSLPEVIGWPEAMFDATDIDAMRAKMEQALTDDNWYQQLKAHALTQAARFSWDRTAQLALSGFEKVMAQPAITPTAKLTSAQFTDKAIRQLAADNVLTQDSDRLGVAWALARNSFSQHQPHLFVDVSVLVEQDTGTGTQRVARNVLNILLRDSAPGYQVRPIYCQPGGYYHYANQYQAAHFDTDYGNDEPVLFCKDDIMVVADHNPHLFPHLNIQLDALRRAGAKAYFIVHDLTPISQPQWLNEENERLFSSWLQSLAENADGIICPSKSVAENVRQWIEDHKHEVAVNPYLTIKHVQLGADFDAIVPARGISAKTEALLGSLLRAPTFLMIGDIEPRKAYDQVLAAFEILWQQGQDVNLVLVGKEGWNVQELCQRIRNHYQLNKHLFWLSDISDEFLSKLYQNASALVISSHAEGFDLPLIEAAQKKLPLIVRDIPVFREIAGEYATYFAGEGGEVIYDTINRWLTLRDQSAIPDSSRIPWLTWQQSAQLLLKQLPLLQVSQDAPQ